MDDDSVKQSLLAMANEDQAMREKALKDSAAWDYAMDAVHTNTMKRIIEEYGWPTIARVGVQASNDAWLIVQHADHDRAFQKKCLRILKSLKPGEVSLHNIAYLEDRLLVAEGKPQLYGTQFQGKGKDLKPRPIRDEISVDQRRKAMGLDTLAQYQVTMHKMYGGL